MSENYRDENQSFNERLFEGIQNEIKELNKIGTAASRLHIAKLEERLKYFQDKLKYFDEWKDEHKAENDYEFKSIATGNKVLFEGILPEQKKRTDMAVDFAKKSAEEAARACIAVEASKDIVSEAKEISRSTDVKLTLMILVMIGGIFVSSVFGFLKYFQDKDNQKEMIKYLRSGVAVKETNGGVENVAKSKQVNR
jgi:uncharacterized coiled-coil protein SlyX